MAEKNFLVFMDEDTANDYVMSKLEEKIENRFEKLAEDYDRIESKKDFEKLFDVKLDENSYERIKGFIDYLRK